MKDDLNEPSTINQPYFSDMNVYLFVSFLLGILLGLAALVTGIKYIYAPWPAHGPVGVVGAFLVIVGLLIILGSILVLKKENRNCWRFAHFGSRTYLWSSEFNAVGSI
ncbi:MAG: hypothetical protein QHH18_06520 [Candidatus Bathyarchaeota archaeon]|jgi:uncharacterized membrane protein YcjF (UPF0283 family)|nr:hypothetical protein [Candidatus Bathyarchaeota archaeon A05DMB-5]MDH7558240.1 hypothetical protein [Candidatus Bathyarchaeota archaeon]